MQNLGLLIGMCLKALFSLGSDVSKIIKGVS